MQQAPYLGPQQLFYTAMLGNWVYFYLFSGAAFRHLRILEMPNSYTITFLWFFAVFGVSVIAWRR